MRWLLMLGTTLALAGRGLAAVPATITWDRWGVPHVDVPDGDAPAMAQLRALGEGFGYATARDRLYQLEIARRSVTGRLSELPFARRELARDIASRRDGLTDPQRRAALRRLPGRFRALFEGFGRGVNRFIDEVRADPARAPAEFFFPGLDPSTIEPWRPEDTVALTELSRAYEFGGNEPRNAVTLLDLLDRFPDAEAQGIITDLFWLEDPTAPTTIEPAEGTAPAPRLVPFASAQIELLRRHADSLREVAAALEEEQAIVGPYTPASNAIVVGGRLTASGLPILLGGAQVGLRMPNAFHEIALRGGGFDAALLVPPSNVALGRTARTVWTVTSSLTDTVDWYVEELRPGNARQYRHRGRWRDMACRQEVFRVADQAPVTQEFCRTVHGPVFMTFPARNVAFSRQSYVAGRELASAAALLGLGFARDLRHARRTIDRIGISLHVLWADADGHIAFFTRGVRPRRHPDFDPRLPLPGTGEAEPRGVMTGRALPSLVDPARGYLVQWNNKPIRGWSADGQRELWGGVDRVQTLIDQVEAARAGGVPLTGDDVGGFMRRAATSDLFAARLIPFLVAAVRSLPLTVADRGQLETAADLIGTWVDAGAPLIADASGDIPYPGMTIYRAWREAVQHATFADELGPHGRGLLYFQTRTLGNWDDSGNAFTPDALLVRALEGPAAEFPTSRDYFADVTRGMNPGRDATLVAALRRTLAELAAARGTVEMARWLTPRIQVRFFDEAGAEVFFPPVIVERANRGAVNFIVEPGAAASVVVPPGNSGYIPPGGLGAVNLYDQLPLYESFQYRSWRRTGEPLEDPTMTETLMLDERAGR